MSVVARLSATARDFVSARFRDLGYPLTWLPPRVLSRRGQWLGVDFAMLAAHLMLSTPRPYFIGIGANDGVTHDPLYPFVRDFGWRGVMIEPIPEAFAALEQNYAGFGEVSLVQAAIGKTDGSGTIYTIEVSDRETMMMSLHSSFNRDILLRGMQWHQDLEQRVAERQVPLLSFATLLRRIGAETVDVLKIDTEGYDLEILRTVDLVQLAPSLVIAEHANISKKDKIEMADILLDHGYRVAMTPLDMLAYKAPATQAARP